MVIPPLNSSALRAQYEHGRGEAGRFAAVDRAKNRRKENTKPCAFHGSYPHKCTAGTLALRQGMPLHAVAKMLGHSDPAMTLRRYAHVLEDMEDEGGRAMDNLF